MKKITGLIVGLLLGIIGSAILVYADTLIHPDCESLWKCSSSVLFKFGPVNIMIIMALAGAIIGLVIGIIIDRK